MPIKSPKLTKNLKISLCITSLFALGNPLNADTIKLVQNSTLNGTLRIGHLNQDPSDGPNSYATAVGGILKYERPFVEGLNAGVAFYTSHTLSTLSGDKADGSFNYEMSGEDARHYDLLAEAYLAYKINTFSLTLGRQRIDTPYADSDDIRITPNTFEGAVASYTYGNTTLLGAYLTRWQGPDTNYAFEDLIEGEDGVTMIAATYENGGIEGGLWYYHADATADIVYGEVTTPLPLQAMPLTLSLHAASQNEIDNSGIDATLAGAMVESSYGLLNASVAYDALFVDTGKSYFGGFGGGVCYAAMDDLSAGGFAEGTNVHAYKVALGFNLSETMLPGLEMGIEYGNFHAHSQEVAEETDLLLTYAPENQPWSAELIFADINDKLGNQGEDGEDMSYRSLFVRLNYEL